MHSKHVVLENVKVWGKDDGSKIKIPLFLRFMLMHEIIASLTTFDKVTSKKM